MAYKHHKRTLTLSADTFYSGATELSQIFSNDGTPLTVQYQGADQSSGNTTTLNFIGTGVTIVQQSGGSTIDIYIPALSFPSHWNTTDGSTTGTVSESNLSRTTTRISTPTSEGTPFFTGGWAASNRATTLSDSVTITSSEDTVGFGGDSTMEVRVINGSGGTEESFTTAALDGDGVYSASNISVTISNYAVDTTKFKAKASVTVDIGSIFPDGGRYSVEVDHITDSSTDGGDTYSFTQTDVFYDPNPSTPAINGSVTINETDGAVVTKHISGIEYYDTGSSFTPLVTDIDNLNANTQAISGNLSVEGVDYGLTTLTLEPFNDAGFTGWTNTYDTNDVDYSTTGWSIDASSYRFRGTTANASSTPSDAWGSGSAANTANASILVDTYAENSSNLIETFNGESRRLESDYTTSWDSTASLTSGEALVMGGMLQIPVTGSLEGESNSINTDWSTFSPSINGANPDYGSLAGASNFYRVFTDTSGLERSSFTMTFAGTFVSNATTDLANGDLQVTVRRVNSTDPTASTGTSANALFLNGALYNFATFDDGATDGQIRQSSSSVNVIEGTFGGRNCVGGIYCEVIINNSNIKISQISLSFS